MSTADFGTVSHAASAAARPALSLGFGFSCADLYDPTALARLDREFRNALATADDVLSARFEAYRASNGASLRGHDESALLIEVGRHLEGFVARLFGIEAEAAALHVDADGERAVSRMKKELWKKRGLKRLARFAGGASTVDARATMRRVLAVVASVPDAQAEVEVTVARAVVPLLDLEDRCGRALAKGGATIAAEELAKVARWAAALADEVALPSPALTGDPLKDARAFVGALLDLVADGAGAIAHEAGPAALRQAQEGPLRFEDGLSRRKGWVAFRAPATLDHHHLVHVRRPDERHPEITVGPAEERRTRDGFSLTDARMSRLEVANEVDYCVLCHDREKDSCRRGVPEAPPKGEKSPSLADRESPVKNGKLKPNPLGVMTAGCPLEERIGEMHALRAEGRSIGALAIVVIDNPMVPGTGHRICNDCMKACIFQKQDPVNIPQAETGVLTDVLRLPWGVEIYGLLTRWNPLDAKRPSMRAYNGKNVLVVGMGPAGYTLAHHLLNEGFGVVGVDGLKIEPMPVALVGDPSTGRLPTPVRDYSSLERDLATRPTLGFGGVAEYGITIRWDKNFLDLLAMTLLRRRTFRIYGGVRFGGTLTLQEAFEMGIDHVAIAAGAGKPTLIDVPNALARGVRLASDFLMALQLTGASKPHALANLQVRLPAVVVGGGLTGIDTATELAAYYVVQAERALDRIDALVAEVGEIGFWRLFDEEETEILRELCDHGRAIRTERKNAAFEHRSPRFQDLVESWGGVSLAYRRTMSESPAYRLNHEEIIKAFEEGIRFVERVSPKEILVDARGAASGFVFDRMKVEDGKL
ncbi:MAG: FAD-dependent oxidoreductase, partial [Polyangiales bacterium]